jgi:hypothetical protein
MSARRNGARGPAAERPAPPQGFESEGTPPDAPLQPPSASELIGSAAEVLLELARSGLSAAARQARGGLARLGRDQPPRDS